MKNNSFNGKSFAAGLASLALCVGMIGCHACGGACNDYASPVAGSQYGHCNACRAGSVQAPAVEYMEEVTPPTPTLAE